MVGSLTTENLDSKIMSVPTENHKLKQRVLELEGELSSLQKTSFFASDLTTQVCSLSRYCLSDGAVGQFSMTTLWKDVKRIAPDLIRLLHVVGDCTRNVHDNHDDDGPLAIEQIKGLVALCTLSNSR